MRSTHRIKGETTTNFLLSEDQKMLQAMVRDFATNRLAPIADQIEQAQEFPWENFKALADLGLTGMGIPERHGGSGGDRVSTVVALEEIGMHP